MTMKFSTVSILSLVLAFNNPGANAFIPQNTFKSRLNPSSSLQTSSTDENESSTEDHSSLTATVSKEITEKEEQRLKAKQALIGLLGGNSPSSSVRIVEPVTDPVLACPETKEPLALYSSSPLLMINADEGKSRLSRAVSLVTSTTEDGEEGLTYTGRTDTYYNLLESTSSKSKESAEETESDVEGNEEKESLQEQVWSAAQVFIPPPIRGQVNRLVSGSSSYIPMRDLFTSPAVSFAYERGWRQGFAAAGFPGADEEFQLVQDFFDPINPKVVVDMSCATGLFTRRLAKSGKYPRVIGCDYSDSMLTEARRRITQDSELMKKSPVELVRCDVAKLPFSTESLDCLHAGAAMHCWPELQEGLNEIYRALKPGGRYFATTFLSSYFRQVRAAGSDNSLNEQAFQYFETTDQLKDYFLIAGFSEENIDIEVLGNACVVMRCKKE